MAITYSGTTIPHGKHRVEPMEFPVKKWGYPGVDGVDFMPMGMRERVIVVEGRSTNSAPLAESTMNGWMDGNTHTLVTGSGSYTALCIGFEILDVATDQDGLTYRVVVIFEEMEP